MNTGLLLLHNLTQLYNPPDSLRCRVTCSVRRTCHQVGGRQKREHNGADAEGVGDAWPQRGHNLLQPTHAECAALNHMPNIDDAQFRRKLQLITNGSVNCTHEASGSATWQDGTLVGGAPHWRTAHCAGR